MLATPDGLLGGRDLVEAAAEMDGRGVEARGIGPWDRAVQGPVDLEDAGPVAKAAQTAHVCGGKDGRCDRGDLVRARVEEHDA